MKTSTLLTLVVASVALVAGCETVDRAVLVQQVTPASTNSSGVITPARTNFAVRPEIETGIAVVGALPTPYTAIGSAAAGLILAGYAAWRGNRHKKTNVALVKGVEAFRAGLPESQDEKLTKILKDRQEAAGIRPEVTRILEKIRQ